LTGTHAVMKAGARSEWRTVAAGEAGAVNYPGALRHNVFQARP
jgi:hypothetical protein